MKISPYFLFDFYKTDHIRQYPKGTSYVNSNFTPRSNNYSAVGAEEVVVFGIQYYIKEYLINLWNKEFFEKPKDLVVQQYRTLMDRALGQDAVPYYHIAELHDLGYLPVEIKALPEGTLCPIGVPLLTICNTNPNFFWLTNALETSLSNILWKPMTSATTSYAYRKEFERHSKLTGSPKEFIGWQGHDFSYRGMSGLEDACMSGGGHLLSFNGTDTIPAIEWLNQYYPSEQLIGGSVPATEHSVMCMGGDGIGELETFKRLITEIYPSGIVSIVSDTWDFWKVMTEYLPALKKEILARNGRVVIRPDSGDPVDIICGYDKPKELYRNPVDARHYHAPIHESKGAYELLWDTFGGTINEQGYKVLNPKIGLIYGDSINFERQKLILKKLEEKGFAASNLVLGIGSYSFQYTTRDSLGFAMKATFGIVNGEEREIYKDPKTDSGLKKSLKGLLQVYKDESGKIKVKDQCTWEEESQGLLEPVFRDGKLLKDFSLTEIREKLWGI